MALGNSRSAEQDHFDLLPFIAIMMCLLGTLLLVTMSMAAINIGAGAGEGWVPEPDLSPGAKTPVLIEWDGQYAVWHSQTGLRRIEENFVHFSHFADGWIRVDADMRMTAVRKPEPNALDPLIDYLEAHHQSHYALFAVRPSGFGTFRKFAARFEDRDIEVGSEPIEQGKGVRLILPPGATR